MKRVRAEGPGIVGDAWLPGDFPELDRFESFVRNHVHPSRLGELAGLTARCLRLADELVPDRRKRAKAEQLEAIQDCDSPSRGTT